MPHSMIARVASQHFNFERDTTTALGAAYGPRHLQHDGYILITAAIYWLLFASAFSERSRKALAVLLIVTWGQRVMVQPKTLAAIQGVSQRIPMRLIKYGLRDLVARNIVYELDGGQTYVINPDDRTWLLTLEERADIHEIEFYAEVPYDAAPQPHLPQPGTVQFAN